MASTDSASPKVSTNSMPSICCHTSESPLDTRSINVRQARHNLSQNSRDDNTVINDMTIRLKVIFIYKRRRFLFTFCQLTPYWSLFVFEFLCPVCNVSIVSIFQRQVLHHHSHAFHFLPQVGIISVVIYAHLHRYPGTTLQSR